LFPEGRIPDDFRNDVAALGPVRQEYRFTWAQGGVRIVSGFIFLFLGLFFLFAMVRGWALNFEMPLPTVLTCLGFIAGVLGMGLYPLQNVIGRTNSHAFLCEEGLAYSDGKVARVARWDDIASVRDCQSFFFVEGHPIWPRRRITITDRNGGTAMFTEAYSNIIELGNAIVNEVTRRQVPRILDRIRAGETVEFGRLALSSAGVTMDGQLLPWAEVASVKPGIYIEKIGRQWLTWGHISESLVPNAQAFLQLAETFLKHAGWPVKIQRESH
jgi:hypothetical protein